MAKVIKKETILMVYVGFATFVKRDITILESKYNVEKYHFNTSAKYFLPFTFIKQFFSLLLFTKKYKKIVVQSSGYVSFFPVIFGKLFRVPVIIIAIGTDCAKLPEINYGAHTKSLLAWFTRFSFRKASLILPVHKSLENSTYTYIPVKYNNQGIRSFVKNIKTPIIEMVNGYDLDKWSLLNLKRQENSFLTVTFALNEIGHYRKGIDLILLLANAFPTYQFTIVGKVYLIEDCPKNVHLISNVVQKELVKIYNSHQYYLQLSMFEGFPNALCEAMLCGCIPIGSNVAGIPDIIGEQGYILKEKKEADLLKIITDLPNSLIKPIEVRNQIATNFSIQRRIDSFLEYV